ISGSEFGSWPTPTCSGLDGGSNSRRAAKARGRWPTPTKSDAEGGPRKTPRADRNPDKPCDLRSAVRMYPTPTARDWKDGTAEACRNVPVNSLLGRQVHAIPPHPNDQPGGMLNPDWVEW